MFELIADAPEISFVDYFSLDLKPGLVMEFGVATGGTINVIAKCLPDRTIYGFDSFEGLPEVWNGLEIGAFKCGIPSADSKRVIFYPKVHPFIDEIVKEVIEEEVQPELEFNVVLVVGLFHDTLQDFLREHEELISLIHIDCDLYSSTKYVLTTLKDRFQNGSVIIFDELINYDNDKWKEHEYKAWCEFLEETKYQWKCLGKHGPHQVGFEIFKE